MKKNTSIRIDEDQLEKLKKMGLSLSEVINQAVSQAIKQKQCPTCGQKLKEKK